MNKFWHWGKKGSLPGLVDSPELLHGEGSLYFILNEEGLVVDASPALRRLLPDGLLVKPVPLSEFMAQPAAELNGSAQYWPAHISSLVLRSRSGAHRYFQAGLLSSGDGWLMHLLENTELILRMQDVERRRQLLSFSVNQAITLREALPGQAQEVVEEWLEGLALRLQATALGLFLKDKQGKWSLYAQTRLAGTELLPWSSVELLRELASLDEVSPRTWSLPESAESVWLVPYCEQAGVQAWLVVAGADIRQKLSFFSDTDWLTLLMLVASPLSCVVSSQNVQQVLQRNARFQQVLESGWLEFHVDSNRVTLAPSLLRVLGCEPDADDSITLEQFLGLIQPLDREQLSLHLQEAAELGLGFNQVVCVQGTGGENLWFRLHCEVLGKTGRKIIGYAINVSDLQQQKAQAEAANARLEGLLDNAPAVIFVQSYNEGTLGFTFCSASLPGVLGWSLEDLQGQHFASFVHREDRELYFDRTRTLLQAGYVSTRYRVRNQNGNYHWLLEEAKLLRDAMGRPLEVVGLLLDVTEATAAAEQISKSEERYRVLVEDAPAIICRYRPDLTLTFANKPMVEGLELQGLSLGSVNLGQYLSPEEREATLVRLSGMTPERPTRNIEFALELPGRRRVRWAWVERGLFDSDGQLREVQAVGRDDTEVHNAREQLYQSAKMATLGEMATGLAHEMNQPLTVMRMALNNLSRCVDRDELTMDYLRGKLRRLESQVTRASRIVDHVRIFGRRSEDQGELFDPVGSVEEAVGLVSQSMAQNDVTVELELRPVSLVQGHHDRLEQVLINLLLNAQYAVGRRCEREPEHRPWIKVSTREVGNGVLIDVEDNGGGVSPDLLDRIFEPFVTTKPAGQGTGLGLSVSYGIIRQMRGELTVRNLDEGACFAIFLPVGDAREPDAPSFPSYG